jgi:uncharacterized repeat protein (TIGR03806 family)
MALALAGSAFLACGDDSGGGSSPDADAGVEGGVNPDGGPPPPTPSPFGLDARPSNTTCLAPARPVLDTPVKLDPAFPGVSFNQPMTMAQAPGDDNRWYVVERGGAIRTFTVGSTNVTTFATITNLNTSGEGGLLGIAFPPNFQTSRALYVYYTRNGAVTNFGTNMRSIVARLTSANGTTADGPPVELFDIGQPYSNHDGGTIAFGNDGMLYLGLGDGGSGNDPLATGQDLSHPLGKILRFDVSNTSSSTYAIPSDNPYANAPNSRKCTGYEPPPGAGSVGGPCQEIWAYGFRNPFRFSFDRTSGELWVGDVGQDTWEEIDARVQKGGNYGWKLCEGKHQRGSTSTLCNAPGTILPIVEHNRSEARAIIGGYVYRGAAMPTLQGTYIYGDEETGNIWSIVYDNDGQPSAKTLVPSVGTQLISSFAQGNDGEVYVVLMNGQVRKFLPNGAVPPDTFPKTLKATGCVDPNDATKPAPGLVPYDLVSPLWSDGADKQRFIAIPDGTTITIKPDGDWDFPNRTVLVKNFSVAGKRVETRLFMRHDDGGWAGYSYEWNDAQTDATLLPGASTKVVGSQTWTYPSRSQCVQCHTPAAGGALGPETMNMNRDVVYASTNRISPQLATLEHIGMFSAPLPPNPPAMPAPSDANATMEGRARAYLHSNCSHCHRPQGGGQGTMDLRFSMSFKDTNTCNATNTQGAVGGATKIITPGDPAQSIMSLRVHATDSKRMPPIAVSIPDPLGATVIDGFIRSLTACP